MIVTSHESVQIEVRFLNTIVARNPGYGSSRCTFQSKPALCPVDILIVPTIDTKVTEYLCSGWFFFFRQNSTLSHSKAIVFLSLNLKTCFSCDPFS